MIRNIIFDVGYVLIDYTWEQQFSQMGYSKEEIDRMAEVIFGANVPVYEGNVWEKYDNGLASTDEIRKICNERFPEDRKALDWFFDCPAEWAVPMNDMADLIPALKDKGYGVYLLSNYPDDLWQAHVAVQPFYRLIDGAVVSYAEHIGKPDEAFFRTLLERYKLDAGECLFLDDLKKNTQAAEKLGFNTVTLDSPKKRADAIKMLSDLPDIS